MVVSPLVKLMQIHTDIYLPRTDTIDAYPSAFQTCHTSSYDSQRGMIRHCEGRAPAASAGTCYACHDDDAAVRLVFWGGVEVVALGSRLLHCRRGVLEGKEGHHCVGFEELVDVCGCGIGDRGRSEET